MKWKSGRFQSRILQTSRFIKTIYFVIVLITGFTLYLCYNFSFCYEILYRVCRCGNLISYVLFLWQSYVYLCTRNFLLLSVFYYRPIKSSYTNLLVDTFVQDIASIVEEALTIIMSGKQIHMFGYLLESHYATLAKGRRTRSYCMFLYCVNILDLLRLLYWIKKYCKFSGVWFIIVYTLKPILRTSLF